MPMHSAGLVEPVRVFPASAHAPRLSGYRVICSTPSTCPDRMPCDGVSRIDTTHLPSVGHSNQLLEWKGIEATERLAESKSVIIGSAKNGLPVVLQDQDGQ